MDPEVIRSRQNPRVKELRRLATRKGRWGARLFLAEGPETVREALKAQIALSLFVNVEKQDEYRDLLAEADRSDVETLFLAPSLYDYISTTATPPGVLAICPFLHDSRDGLLAGQLDLVVLAVRPRDPGNLGTLIRTAAAAGVDGMVISGQSVDLYNPKVVRATMGGMFLLPLALDSNAGTVLESAKKAGLTLVGSVPRGGEDLFSADLSGRALLVLGGEVEGLPTDTRLLCDRLVSIPMSRQTDSLNLATAGAILIYEAMRQRAALPSERAASS